MQQEDDIKYAWMEDNLIIFVNGRQLLLLEMEDDLNIAWKCCQMQYFTILSKNKARLGVEVGEKRIIQAQ